MPKPRRTFNKQLAIDTAARDDSTILGELEEPCRSGTMIEFECICGTQTSKRLDSAVDYGMYCKDCTDENRNTKRATTLALDRKLQEHLNYDLKIGDNPAITLPADTELQLTVAPGFIKTCVNIGINHGTQRYIVQWWDQSTNKLCRKYLWPLEAAEEFQSSLPPVPENYTVAMPLRVLSKLTPNALRMYKITRAFKDYPPIAVPVEAYCVSSWLGDGTASATEITSIDEATVGYWRDYASRLGLNFKKKKDTIAYTVSGNGGEGNNLLLNRFRDLGLIAKHQRDPTLTKHIPDVYKYNCKEVRMQIVAGLIDTDGSLNRSSDSCPGVAYDFSQSLAHERLFDDLREVVLSLGWQMSKNYCIKTCKYKGEMKKCPAIRGYILGDDSMMDLPIKLAYKRITKKRQYRHDLQKITITPAAACSNAELRNASVLECCVSLTTNCN